jgi:hypothetical protein
MVFEYSTPKESIRLGTATSYKASPMRFLNQPKRLRKRRKQRTRRGGRNSQPGRS